MMRMLKNVLSYPYPYRVKLAAELRKLKNRCTNAPYLYPTVFSEVPRPQYGYCIYHAALLAKALGIPRISVIEFGVANGAGLRDIEFHVKKIKKQVDVGIDVFGFDLKSGLPETNDYRDLLFKWSPGAFPMLDKAEIENSLDFSTLIIGNVKETCKTFYTDHYKGAPIGCVFFDLDLYSSTKAAFQIFNTSPENYLPRIYCFFDDILGTNEYIGELAAIKEFNETIPTKKIARPYGLFTERKMDWTVKIFMFHDFEHSEYNKYIRIHDADFI
jgi:hypothetical protein